MEELEDLLEGIAHLERQRGYWLIRTEGGQFYQSFYEGGYIAVGWNEISIKDIRERSGSAEDLKAKISKAYNIDTSKPVGSRKVGTIASKLINYDDKIKRGDIVVIPAYGSHRIAFGIIDDERLFAPDVKDSCPFVKRRKVTWHDEKSIRDLDSKFYLITKSFHAISKIDKYADYINRHINTVFVRENSAHIVINILSEEDVSAEALFQIPIDLISISAEITRDFGYDVDTKRLRARMNVQSPGTLELISLAKEVLTQGGAVAGSIMIIVIILIVLVALCGGEMENKLIGKFKTSGIIQSVWKVIREKKELKQKFDRLEQNKKNSGIKIDEKSLAEALDKLVKKGKKKNKKKDKK